MASCLDQLSSEDRELLSTAFHTKQTFFWIGSGFSRNFGYASWTGILEGLAKKYDYKGTLPENPLRCAELLCAAARESGVDVDKFSEEVCGLLRSSREKVEKPAWAHDFARMASDIIVTTNWDHVLEEDVFDGYATVIIRRVGSSQLDRSGRNILKIHGDINFPESLVFTHSQYNAFQREDNYLSRKVYTLFAEMTPIFLGYSLSDPNIFFLFDEALVDGNNANRAFMVIPTTTPEDKLLEYRLLLKSKGVTIITADIGEFLAAVDEELKAIQGTITDFKNKYKVVVPRIEEIIKTAGEGRQRWDVLAAKFNTKETGQVALRAMAEILSNADLYESMGGSLSPLGKRIPKYASHIIAQTGISISNNHELPLPSQFTSSVIRNAIQGLADRDFNSSAKPLTDLMSVHVVNVHPLFKEKIKTLVEVFDWSAPKYRWGYCWATWDTLVLHMDWLREEELEGLLDYVDEHSGGGRLTSNTIRWLKVLTKKMSSQGKARAEELMARA